MIWRGRKDRVPQPAVSPATRDPEQHDFWLGAILTAGAILLLMCGAGHRTRLETVDGDEARETQLVKAFAYGGLHLAKPPAPPDPAKYNDPVEAAAALDRFAREEKTRPRMKYVVNTGAVDPCPT